MFSKYLEKRQRVLMLLELDPVLEKTCKFFVRVVNFENKPVKNVNVKVFRIEKEAIALMQWTKNLKNGTPFKKLILSMNADNNGVITAELPKGVYEAKVEKYGLNKVFELTKNAKFFLLNQKRIGGT